MTRTILAALAACAFVTLMAAPGCKQTGVGDPCLPEQEYSKSFLGFDQKEVNVESKSFQCQTRLCLVNHFRGRVSCPYGQDNAGNAPNGASPCTVPGTGGGGEAGAANLIDGKDADGNIVDQKKGQLVSPQCTDRKAADAVYCSCRCANVDGKTDDGASYCECPEAYACTQLVSSIGPLDTGLTGAYCIKKNTEYRSDSCAKPCNPTTSKCDAAGTATATNTKSE